MKRIIFSLLMIAGILAGGSLASAHEVRPAYLKIAELSPDRFELTFKQPLNEGQRLNISPSLPDACQEMRRGVPRHLGSAVVEKWIVDCSTLPEPAALTIVGLDKTIADVFVEVDFLSGDRMTLVLKPDASSFVLGEDRVEFSTGYLSIGVSHLLSGFDHILFVVGLVFLSRRLSFLVRAVTAFTIAHSLTLGLSALGLITVSQSSIELLIALSIMFLGVEILRGREQSLLARHPWSITFTFGLLHGLGFASAIGEVGLPEKEALWALLQFNIGVEIGQLLIVLVAVTLLALSQRILRQNPLLVQTVQGYVVGVPAAFWFIERSVGAFHSLLP